MNDAAAITVKDALSRGPRLFRYQQRESDMAYQSIPSKKLPAWSRMLSLGLAVMILAGIALAIPAGTQAQSETIAAAQTDEKLIFDWNKPVLQAHSGFAQEKPTLPAHNGNWTVPPRFANGTLYFRARVISIPKNQPGMKLGFCFWQQKPKWGEECTKNFAVAGVPGTDVTWTQTMDSLNAIGGAQINWAYDRWKQGFVVRNSRGKPVSNKLNFNWSGENPKNWYPLNIHYTVVLVAPGGTFNGWKNYGW
jgi:hypothetical protein